MVYPKSFFSSYKQITVPANSVTHTIERLSQVTPHSSYLPNENISDPSNNSATNNIENLSQVTSDSLNSITFTTLENLSQVTPCLGNQSQHF